MQKSSTQVVSSCSSCRRAQHKRSAHGAHAEELSTRGQLMQLMQKSSAQEVSSCSSCRTAQHSSCRRAQPQLMQESSATAHTRELSIAHVGELSHSSCRRAQHSSCKRAQPQLMQKSSTTAHAAHAEELSHNSCRRAQHSSCRRAQPQLMQKKSAHLMQESLSTAHAGELSSDQRGQFGRMRSSTAHPLRPF